MLNSISIQGRLVKNPEITYTQSNDPTAIATYRIASQRDYKVNDEYVTDFITVKVFGKAAEWAEKHLEKGKLIIVTGRLTVDNWQDDNGNHHSFAYIKAEKQYFCEGKAKDDSATTNEADDFVDPFAPIR